MAGPQKQYKQPPKPRQITDEDREALIDLITWYRDKYHKKDWCHSEMIARLRSDHSLEIFELYEAVVDGWLD